MRRVALVALLLAGCATSSSDAPRAELDSHQVGPTSPTNPNNHDPQVYTHIEPSLGEAHRGAEGSQCGTGCAADEVCDSSGAVHRCLKKGSGPAWLPGAQPASSTPGK